MEPIQPIRIEDYLRHKMIVLAQTKGNLCHPEVVRVSQQLDVFLNQVQGRMNQDSGIAVNVRRLMHESAHPARVQ